MARPNDPPPGTTPPRRPREDRWLTLLYGLLLLAALLLFIFGAVDRARTGGVILLGFGALAIIFIAAIFPVAAVLLRYANRPSDQPDQPDRRIVELLESINERMLISDTAKRIAFRVRDRDALRKAIVEDVDKGDLDAALVLANEMVHTYGYRREGEELRQQILTARTASLDRQVVKAIGGLEQMLARREWEPAIAEARRIQQAFPDSPRVANLPQRVHEAKEQHKRDLERQFLEAARRDDVETAMDLLKQLDGYLTEKEAAPFLEVARGVIGKKRQNLGVQFKLAIQDHEWTDALAVGEQIMREFPNTKMAEEVQSMMTLLRERAASQQEAAREGL